MKKPILFLAMILAGATYGAAKDQSRDPYTEPADTATVDTSGWAALSGPLASHGLPATSTTASSPRLKSPSAPTLLSTHGAASASASKPS